jgi:hypothetical protein
MQATQSVPAGIVLAYGLQNQYLAGMPVIASHFGHFSV